MYSMGQVVIVKYVGFGWWPAKVQYFTKEIKNAPECIVELYKHAGIFKNTREVHKEARGAAECFSHFSSVLKNSRA